MKYIFKHTIKNILAKPGRSLILIVCITLTALTAMMAVDMTESIIGLLKAFVSDSIGTADITAVFPNKPNLEGLENCKFMGVASTMLPNYSRDEELYWYSFQSADDVIHLNDYAYAEEQGMLDKSIVLEDGEIAINRIYADSYGVDVGDKVTLMAVVSEEEREFTIKEIVSFNLPAFPKDNTMILVNENDYCFLTSTKEIRYEYFDIDVLDDKEIAACKEIILENNPDCIIVDTNDAVADEIQGIRGAFFLIFVLTLLLVFFITISFSEKIVTERMSTVGTLRSLGVSDSKTAFFLLLENAVYAFVGAVIGCILYGIVKKTFIPMFMNLSVRGEAYDIKAHLPKTPFYMYLAAVGVSLIVECLYPIKELIKASRTSIRDIIFDNKDTEYRYTWKRLYAGLVLLVVSVVSMFLVKSFIALSISLVTAVLASAILIPYLLKVMSNPLAKLFGSLKMPIAKLASSEVYNNKSMVSTAVLCVTSLILSSCLFVFAIEMASDITTSPYQCDVMVMNANDDAFTYSFIEDMDGVTKVEFEYDNYCNSTVNGVDIDYLSICEYEHKDLIVECQGLNGTLNRGEIVLTSTLAKKCGVSAGDSIEITFGTDWFKPKTMTFTVKDIVDLGSGYVLSGTTVFINKELMFDLFSDVVSFIFINCDDPAKTTAQLKKYIVEDDETMVLTSEEYDALNTGDTSIEMILFGLIGLAVVITLIGASGNQSIGFINRRRELAVLYSTSMPRAKLDKLLWIENALSVGFSCVIALVVTPIVIKLLTKILNILTGGDLLITDIHFPSIVIFITAFFFIMGLAVIKPVRFLRKMNVAEQLKYE